jgi:Uma2 family endonuclease
MVAVLPLEAPAPAAVAVMEERRILLSNVPWFTYVVFRDTIDSSGIRMTYQEGALEIMSPSRAHEVVKKQIARLLELFCLERGIPLYAYGSMTLRREEKERGLEADECFCRGADRDVPDIAFDVIVTSPLLDKLEVYRGLGVREVWVYRNGGFVLHALRDERYEPIAASEIFPEVDLPAIARYAAAPDQHAALRAFRDELRGTSAASSR